MKLSTKLVGVLTMLIIILVAAVPAGAASGKPSIAVGDVKVSPAALMPGDTGTVTVTLAIPAKSLAGDTTSDSNTYNYGTGTSGQYSIGHTQTTTTTSTNTPDGAVYLKEVTLLADSPLHVTSRQYADIGRMGMGDTATFVFAFKVDEGTTDGTYAMTLKVRTDDGDVYLNYPINVQVSNAALKVVINDAPRSFSTTKKSVILDIVNLRPNGVEAVSVVPAGDDFTFKPMQEYVVGNIGPGEMYTVQFDVTSKNATYGGNPSFKVVYRNGNNWHEADPVTIYSDHSATAAVATAGSNDNTLLYLGGIIVVAVLLLGGYFLYMSSKRAKR